MASFSAVLFLRDVLDEIWDLIESASEGFPSYSNAGDLHKRVKYTKEKIWGLRPFQEYSLPSLSRLRLSRREKSDPCFNKKSNIRTKKLWIRGYISN